MPLPKRGIAISIAKQVCLIYYAKGRCPHKSMDIALIKQLLRFGIGITKTMPNSKVKNVSEKIENIMDAEDVIENQVKEAVKKVVKKRR